MQGTADRLPTDRQQEDAPQELTDLLDPEVRMASLQRDGLPLHRQGDLRSGASRPPLRLQAGLALRAIRPNPRPQRAQADAEIAGDLLDGEAFLHTELDRFTSELHGVGVHVRPS